MRSNSIFSFLMIFGIIILVSGCETAKGLTKGVAYTIADTGRGVAKDSCNFWQGIIKAEEWIKENLW